jgi:hypothetical protein
VRWSSSAVLGALAILLLSVVVWQLILRKGTSAPPPTLAGPSKSGSPPEQPAADPTAEPRSLSTQDIFQTASGGMTLIETFDEQGRKRGQGSGFVVSADGSALTNYHVIRGASRATAKFGDGTWSEVSGVIGYDPARDVAVIKLLSSPKTVLEMGDSDTVKVGQNIVAIGSPLGFQNTVSEGIVGGLRNGLIQMTDPISHGSSGGAVFDRFGNVVGISVATMESGQNLNFAVPINWAKPYLNGENLRPLADIAAENTVTQTIFDGSASIPAGQVRSWNVTLNQNVMANAEIQGQVASSGGVDGKITLAVYFQNQPLYNCRATACSIHQDIAVGGVYQLVLDNRTSAMFPRTVTGEISLKYVK